MGKTRYWLMKSEPDAYGWDDLVEAGSGIWDGVRNHQAAAFMREMRVGDQVLFYHSVTGKEAVGIMEVSEAAFPDPTFEPPIGKPNNWVVVRVKPVRKLKRPVTLAQMKDEPKLSDMPMLRQSRLSVCPLSKAEWGTVLKLSGE